MKHFKFSLLNLFLSQELNLIPSALAGKHCWDCAELMLTKVDNNCPICNECREDRR